MDVVDLLHKNYETITFRMDLLLITVEKERERERAAGASIESKKFFQGKSLRSFLRMLQPHEEKK